MERSRIRDYVETLAIVFFMPAALLFVVVLILLLSHWRITGLYARHVAWFLTGFSLTAGLAVWLCHISDANSRDEIMFAFAGIIGLSAGVLAVVLDTDFFWAALVAVPFLVIGIFFRINEAGRSSGKMTSMIYKIVDTQTWQTAEAAGSFKGASIDLSDGYIHFSSPDQVQETADKHFAGQQDLLLVAVNAESLGERLRWEPSRDGALFPHLYGELSMEHVVSVESIRQDKHGKHLIDPGQ